MSLAMWACIAMAISGAGVMAGAVARSRRVAPDFGEFLPRLNPADRNRDARLADPLVYRLLGRVGGALAGHLERMVPANYINALGHQLAQAGLSRKRRAGEQLAIQLSMAAAGAAVVPLIPGRSPMGLFAWLLLPTIGFMLPAAGLKRAIRTRSEAILKDLPDIVDMLAITVEAGSGFESALSIVCSNSDSPLADELSTTLHEMELGLPRREALQQLRARVDSDVVRTLVLALLQADALGIPIGRVLKIQATEVRARRRAWAREKAAKLPIKIMFPLVLFIFPPILALVLGPAVLSFRQL